MQPSVNDGVDSQKYVNPEAIARWESSDKLSEAISNMWQTSI